MNEKKVRILDPAKGIVELVWSGQETPADVSRANQEITTLVHHRKDGFDLLVDMRTVVAWSQETKAAVIEHQRFLLGLGLRRAAVVVGNAVTRMQLNNVKRQSSNDRETQWSSYDEARQFLEATATTQIP